jgi:hypothetical protein
MNGKYGGWDWTSQRKGKVLETVKQKNKKQTKTQTNKKQKQTKRVSRQTRKKQSNKTKQATNIEKGVLLAAK